MSMPEPSRVVRQLRHDVDDIYELLTTVSQTQGEHTARFGELRQALREHAGQLDVLDGRLGGIENTQQQILDLLQGQGRASQQ